MTVPFLITLIFALTIVSTAVVVILDKHDPTKATLWVVVLVLLPVVGLVFYVFFGRNFRNRRIFKGKAAIDLSAFSSDLDRYVVGKEVGKPLPEIVDKHSHIARLLVNSNLSRVLTGNSVEVYHSGVKAFESLLHDIAVAREYIHMEYYIFLADGIGRRIGDVLMERARAGVDVRVIYDSVGSFRLSNRFIDELRAAGVKIFPFQDVRFPLLASRLNYRNHRKLVLVDGVVAHMGGMNVADKYLVGDPRIGKWHDTQIRIYGPAVHALHHVFLEDWAFVTGNEEVDTSGWVEFDAAYDGVPIQIAASGPDSDWASIMQVFFLAISRAERYIYICTPYFVPNESVLTALRTASLSGVDVRILLPSRSDTRFVQWATMSYVGTLLEAGIKVYLFQGGFNHSKIMMIDGEFSTVGSANMDIRSFEDNFEIVALLYDRATTQELEREFIRNILASESIDAESWHSRGLATRFRDAFARLFSPLF